MLLPCCSLYHNHSILTDIPLHSVCSCVSFALSVPSTQVAHSPHCIDLHPSLHSGLCSNDSSPESFSSLSEEHPASLCLLFSCFLIFSLSLSNTCYILYLFTMDCLPMRVVTFVTNALNSITLETFRYLLNE